MPEVAEVKQYDADVTAFFTKFSHESYVSEHFHTMEVQALDLQKEIETAKVLVLSDSGLGEAGAIGLGKALAAIKPTELRSISLARNEIGDAGAASIATGVMAVPNLDILSMLMNNVGDAGFAALVETCRRATFTQLVLSTLYVPRPVAKPSRP